MPRRVSTKFVRRLFNDAVAAGASFCMALTALVSCAPRAHATHQAINLSLVHPLSTNPSGDADVSVRISLLYGRVAAVRGLDLGGLVSMLDREQRGIQLTGAYSHVKGPFGGVQVAGGANFTEAGGTGVQCAGLFNYDEGAISGVQAAGLLNYAQGGFHGVQFSSVLNMSDADGGFLQLSSIANQNAGSFRGLQVAAGFNFAGSDVRGLQLAGVNYAKSVSGIQAGLVNFSREASGAQIGFVNSSRVQNGLPVGMVNLSEGGRARWVSFASNHMAVNSGVRTQVRGVYSMFTIGASDLQGSRDAAMSLTWNYGHAFSLGRGWDLNADLGFVHVMPVISRDPSVNDRLHFALQARALLERSVSTGVSIFGGVGVMELVSEYSTHAHSEAKPLFIVGFSAF